MEIREPATTVASELGLVTTGNSYEEILRKLAAKINELISGDLNQLISVLYRMDISEKKLRHLLQNTEGKDAGSLIATMMIEREAEKIKSRQQHRRNDEGISDEEKW